jgi:uncharacterized protein
MADLLDLIEETPPGRLGITGYRPGAFRIGTAWHEGHLLMLPESVAPWPLGADGAVTLESLAALEGLDPAAEILLLGLGAKAPLLPFELRRTLAGWGLSVEAMPTPSACRTFNLLLAEERRVVAALMAMP